MVPMDELLGGVVEITKWDWEFGFSAALRFDGCDPLMADISSDAYVAGYEYGMDWLIEYQRGAECPCKYCAHERNRFSSEVLYGKSEDVG